MVRPTQTPVLGAILMWNGPGWNSPQWVSGLDLGVASSGARPGISGPAACCAGRYLVIIRLGDAGVGGDGEIANVSHTLKPSGRWSLPNSP